MKKPCLALIAFLSVSQFACAQWTTSGTNIYNSNTGNVGIGTTAPTALFAVGSSSIRGTITVTGTLTGAPVIGLTDTKTSGHSYSLYSGLSAAGDFDVFDQNTSAYRLMINASGNIGIGTITPKSTLHMYGTFITGGASANIDPSIAANIPGNLPNTGQMLIGWNRSAGSGETDFITNQGIGAPGGFAFYNHNNSNVETQLMYIRGDGTVGIGTNDPKGYMLAVAGTAIATSVTVKTVPNWPDYVFTKDFQLPTLAEAETYINQNHHLAEIPSADEVAKNGLNLGEMNKLLLKKVEELTLYLIEKDKKEKEQEARISKLEGEFKNLVKQTNTSN